MNNYTLHTIGPNWFHFRLHYAKHPLPQADSFTITYIPDGTTLLSGDIGCMTWQRHNFPKTPDYGFPYPATNIEYFAGNVKFAESTQIVESWTHDQAMIDYYTCRSRINRYCRPKSTLGSLRCIDTI